MSNCQTLNADGLAEIFRALSNPNRLRLLLRLLACCPPGRAHVGTPEQTSACVGELARGLDIGAPTVSHHLRELRQAGLIQTRRCGQRVECVVGGEAFSVLAAFVREALAQAAPTPLVPHLPEERDCHGQ